jgi:GrpB-like predicted nucleotidyltransferase (UPF0157 family)
MRRTEQSEEELAAVRIGPPEVLNSGIYLVPYDPEWPGLFEREALRIRSILGERVALLEHAGSTSVPGLSAKPVIDIVLAVPDSANEAAYVPDMEAYGYVLRVREADWHEHRLFKGPDTNINLHTFTMGCSEIERMLRFRDHLRTDEADRLLYERTKHDLSQRTWKYTQHYADAKSEVVNDMIGRIGAPPAGSGENCPLH